MDSKRIHYVTFEVDTPAKAAELATLAAAAGFGYASVGPCAQQEGTILGIPTSEARWIATQTLAKLREAGGDAFELIERLMAKPEYAFIEPQDLEGVFEDRDTACMAVYRVEEATGRFVAMRYQEASQDWKALVVEWERVPATRYRLTALAREILAESTQAIKAA